MKVLTLATTFLATVAQIQAYTAFDRFGLSNALGEKKCDIIPQQEPAGNCFDDNTDYYGDDLPGMYIIFGKYHIF